MTSHIDRFTIEKFQDGTFSLCCEKLNRNIHGILDKKELLHDLIRELELSEKED